MRRQDARIILGLANEFPGCGKLIMPNFGVGGLAKPLSLPYMSPTAGGRGP